MQTLAQNGNGTAAYVDTLSEARKVLVDESSSTLFTIAKDVKIQIEWNPQPSTEYRLIGYETRNLKREDFNNDKVDAGDIGSGHTVTAIYEVTPVGSPRLVDDLRYASKATATWTRPRKRRSASEYELGFLKLRYKRPNEDVSQLVTLCRSRMATGRCIDSATADVRFSTAVAAFGQMLKGESALPRASPRTTYSHSPARPRQRPLRLSRRVPEPRPPGQERAAVRFHEERRH